MKIKKYYPYILIILGSLICCWSGFVNGYPFVYPDTGEYLNSGFEAIPPYDRTIFYGLFARHISLFYSLWIVIVAQALLINYLLFRLVEIFFEGRKKNMLYLCSVIFLSFSTGLSIHTSMIMPDIFSACSILALVILVVHPKLKKTETAVIAIIFVYSIATQVSSFLIIAPLLALLILISFVGRRIKKNWIFLNTRQLIISTSLFVFSLLLVPFTHYALGGNFNISNGSHVFMMNHFLEKGILKSYLDKNCAGKNFKICTYKDSLGKNLMWEIEGPLYKTGGWEANKAEYTTIIKDIITTPEYVKTLFKQSIVDSRKQFFTYRVEIAPPQLDNTAPHGQISWRFKGELNAYVNSKQNRGSLNMEWINKLQAMVIPLSFTVLLVLVVLGMIKRTLSANVSKIILIILIYSLINAFICSTLAVVDARYQGRIVWLFPLLAIILSAEIINKKTLSTLRGQ